MSQMVMNFVLVIAISLLLLWLFSHFHYTEGMETQKKEKTLQPSSGDNGIAGNVGNYRASVDEQNTHMQDEFLISKPEYKNEYDKLLVSMDDYFNNLMFKKILVSGKDKPEETARYLATMYQAKQGVNQLVAFVDRSH